ncbi:hypothetical protein IIZ81_00405 [Candidatus Saccharibacteria bacterium]|nr:hypothetical protein [Candidatus Saccharibacteria bacterium]
MFQFNDEFLKSVGLENLPDDQKQDFLEYAQEQFETRIGEAMMSKLTEAQQVEFDKISSDDPEAIQNVLDKYADYENDFTYRRLIKNGADEQQAKSDFAVVKWLDENFPNYSDEINNILADLQSEIYSQKESFLNS